LLSLIGYPAMAHSQSHVWIGANAKNLQHKGVHDQRFGSLGLFAAYNLTHQKDQKTIIT
jgi:hypothetical protein